MEILTRYYKNFYRLFMKHLIKNRNLFINYLEINLRYLSRSISRMCANFNLQEIQNLIRNELNEALYGDDLSDLFTINGIRKMLCLIGRNGQGIGTTSFGYWVNGVQNLTLTESERESLDTLIDDIYNKMEEINGSFLNVDGSGLYSLHSCCNHSCSPNAEVQFPFGNHKLQLVAVKDIEVRTHYCELKFILPIFFSRVRK